MLRRIGLIALILLLIYAAFGVGFHIKWKAAQTACREAMLARGEFVEPHEVFDGLIGLAFTVTYWPVYATANIYLDGTPFATPCTH